MSHEHENLSPELKSLEAALSGLAPSASAIERDRLLYAAGSAAAERRARRSRQSVLTMAAPALLAVLVVLSFTLWLREHRQLLTEREANTAQVTALLAKIESQSPPPAGAIAELPQSDLPLADDKYSYLRLRNVVLEQGAEAMEMPTATGDGNRMPIETPRSRDAWLRGT